MDKKIQKPLTQTDLLKELGKASNLPVNKVKEVVIALQKIIHRELKQNEVIRLFDLGKFRIVSVKERQGINPVTKEMIKIPGGKRVRFSVAAAFAERVIKKKD